MQVRLLFFGIARDATGHRQAQLHLEGAVRVARLRELLREQYPGLGALPDYAMAVNSEYAGEDQLLQTGDEVAVIPPVSGG
jgi:molybdopterin converting factor subunit 1